MAMLHIKLKKFTNEATCKQIFDRRHPPTLGMVGMESVGQNSICSDDGHVAYQIKKNHECSNMVANVFCLPTNSGNHGKPGKSSIKVPCKDNNGI